MTYQMTVVAVAIHPACESPVHGERITRVALADEGAGAFVRVSQLDDHGEQCLHLDPEEIDFVAAAARQLIGQKGLIHEQP